MHHVKVEFDYDHGVLSVSRLDIDLIDYLSDEKYGKLFQEFKGLDLTRNLDFWDRMAARIRTCIADGDDELFFDVDTPSYGQLMHNLTSNYANLEYDSDIFWERIHEETKKWRENYDYCYKEQEKKEAKIVSDLIAPAADAGCTYAQALLGYYYSFCVHGAHDSETAEIYYRKAAKGGLTRGLRDSTCWEWWNPILGLSPEGFHDINEAAAYGNWNAKLDVAVCFLKGICVEKDIAKAVDIARDVLKADLGGNSAALWILGRAREENARTAADKKVAFELYRDASNRWDAYEPAICDLARCYQNGIGTRTNEEAVVYWYKIAANHGVPEAQYRIGLCYEQGIGVKKNLRKAANQYYQAFLDHHSDGMEALIRCFENGIGVRKNKKMAADLREKAASWETARKAGIFGWEMLEPMLGYPDDVSAMDEPKE